MPRINLSGGSYVARSASVSVQRVLNLWHERCTTGITGGEDQIRPLFWCKADGHVYAGDRLNAAIYKVTTEADDDAGTAIIRRRAFPHLLTNGTRGIHCKFMLDMQNENGTKVNVD